MANTLIRVFCLLLLLATLVRGEDALADVIQKTDMTNADSVFALAEWCEQHNKPGHARQYYRKVIELDPDNEGARDRLGQVRVGDRWVSKQSLPPEQAKPAGSSTADDSIAPVGFSGKGPLAKDITWNLKIPPSSGDGTFVDSQIDRMNHSKTDSDDMDSAVITLLRPDCRPPLLGHLCAALLRSDYQSLYGPCQILKGLLDQGQRSAARTLLPFIAVCSAHVTNPDDLEALCYMGPLLHERRLVPRFIELLDSPNADVKAEAARGIAKLTLLPVENLTAARATAWWDANWSRPEREVLGDQLRSKDPATALSAASGLYDLRDKAIMPVLIHTLTVDNVALENEALNLVLKVTGNDWGYSSDLSAEAKAKIAATLSKWWKENQDTFKWVEDRNAAPTGPAGAKAPVANPLDTWVQQLASAEGRQSEQAEAGLRGKALASVPALITGLNDQNVLIRLKCNDILKDLTHQDVGYSARGDDATLAKGIKAWRSWAESQKIPLPPSADDGGDKAQDAGAGGQ